MRPPDSRSTVAGGGRSVRLARPLRAAEEALLEALRVWPEHPPRDPRAWLTTVATRRLVDARRSEVACHRREEATSVRAKRSRGR